MDLKVRLTKQLRGDEGVKPCVYKDHLGFYTIGVGRLVDERKRGAGLRDSEMDFMLSNDIEDRIAALSQHLPWFQELDEARQGVLLNMSFQMGVEGLLAFTRTLGLVRAGRYQDAAVAMGQSQWAQQTPERAGRMRDQMREGFWKYAK